MIPPQPEKPSTPQTALTVQVVKNVYPVPAKNTKKHITGTGGRLITPVDHHRRRDELLLEDGFPISIIFELNFYSCCSTTSIYFRT
ncbi:hypothetical protein TIFTF001_025935 [Ficus carica]|uniref:Uncharacterized protein n=1 Tax=Ficus carica TaxID=3494 RepID=A0AA88AZ91_FICCA|nr:hypothetical protein TIFTF001_025935 [Ficus carica]